MALHFEIKLSFKSAILLITLAEWQKLGSQESNFPTYAQPVNDLSHFISHSRVLERQKLIEFKDKAETLKERWFVTRKGELLAEILQEELTELSALQKQIASTLNSKQITEQQQKAA